MKLSNKMPAQMNSQLDARMPAENKSEAKKTGGDGPMKAPKVPMNQDAGVVTPWQNGNLGTQGWPETSRKEGSEWELTDRKNPAGTGQEYDYPWQDPASKDGTDQNQSY